MSDEHAPLVCPECDGPMRLREGRWGPYYACEQAPRCRGAHGAHPDGRPMGFPAGPETRLARIRAHKSFDRLWKHHMMNRSEAYRWIARKFGRNIHIAELSSDECRELEMYVTDYFDKKVARREAKA